MFAMAVLRVRMAVSVRMLMRVVMSMVVTGGSRVMVFVGEVDVELHTGDGAFMALGKVQVIALQVQRGQCFFQLRGINAQVYKRANKHVAADSTEEIEVKCFHLETVEYGQLLGRCQRVDLARGIPAAETVVDVYHGHAAGAAVEHAQ